MYAQGAANAKHCSLRTATTAIGRLGCITVPSEQIAGVQHHSAGETLIDLVLLDPLTHLRTHAARNQYAYK